MAFLRVIIRITILGFILPAPLTLTLAGLFGWPGIAVGFGTGIVLLLATFFTADQILVSRLKAKSADEILRIAGLQSQLEILFFKSLPTTANSKQSIPQLRIVADPAPWMVACRAPGRPGVLLLSQGMIISMNSQNISNQLLKGWHQLQLPSIYGETMTRALLSLLSLSPNEVKFENYTPKDSAWKTLLDLTRRNIGQMILKQLPSDLSQ